MAFILHVPVSPVRVLRREFRIAAIIKVKHKEDESGNRADMKGNILRDQSVCIPVSINTINDCVRFIVFTERYKCPGKRPVINTLLNWQWWKNWCLESCATENEREGQGNAYRTVVRPHWCTGQKHGN